MFESTAVVTVIVALRFVMAVAAVPELDPATAVAVAAAALKVLGLGLGLG